MNPIAQLSSRFIPAVSVFVLTAGTVAGTAGAAWAQPGDAQRSGALCTERAGDCTRAAVDRGRQSATRQGAVVETDWPWRAKAGADENTDWPWRASAGTDDSTDWPWRARTDAREAADWPWAAGKASAASTDRPWRTATAGNTDWPW
ncbi:hypothetical protein [Streptomyces sp. SID8016]|uniref:hypothetical protein n=1 Tax=Streptomyces sp. SID8016 TaxID=2706098 RepID=UPI0013DC99D1|nr:hypothetical protein [Streptomyces sp. SID8016]